MNQYSEKNAEFFAQHTHTTMTNNSWFIFSRRFFSRVNRSEMEQESLFIFLTVDRSISLALISTIRKTQQSNSRLLVQCSLVFLIASLQVFLTTHTDGVEIEEFMWCTHKHPCATSTKRRSIS